MLGLVLVAFVSHAALHVDPCHRRAARCRALWSLVAAATRRSTLEEVEWPTLVFFMGLFVMVGRPGRGRRHRRTSARRLTDAVGDRYLAAGTDPDRGRPAMLSGIVDNIPYVATMSPLVSDLVAAGGDSPQAESLWWALALGSDLGGNATAVGASANVVVLGLAARNGHPDLVLAVHQATG